MQVVRHTGAEAFIDLRIAAHLVHVNSCQKVQTVMLETNGEENN